MGSVNNKAVCNHYWTLDNWNDEKFCEEYNRITEEHGNFFRVLNDVTKAVIEDVDAFVNSYNYFGCAQNNGQNIKVVYKTARLGGVKKTEIKVVQKRKLV